MYLYCIVLAYKKIVCEQMKKKKKQYIICRKLFHDTFIIIQDVMFYECEYSVKNAVVTGARYTNTFFQFFLVFIKLFQII